MTIEHIDICGQVVEPSITFCDHGAATDSDLMILTNARRSTFRHLSRSVRLRGSMAIGVGKCVGPIHLWDVILTSTFSDYVHTFVTRHSEASPGCDTLSTNILQDLAIVCGRLKIVLLKLPLTVIPLWGCVDSAATIWVANWHWPKDGEHTCVNMRLYDNAYVTVLSSIIHQTLCISYTIRIKQILYDAYLSKNGMCGNLFCWHPTHFVNMGHTPNAITSTSCP